MTPLRKILFYVFYPEYHYPDDDKGYRKKRLDLAHQQILALIPKRKEIINIKKYMCCDGEWPVDCLYDKPESETCIPMDKKIPKEQCRNYKPVQQEYEDFGQWNQAISEMEEAFIDKKL